MSGKWRAITISASANRYSLPIDLIRNKNKNAAGEITTEPFSYEKASMEKRNLALLDSKKKKYAAGEI